jgi:hypothetical protein
LKKGGKQGAWTSHGLMFSQRHFQSLSMTYVVMQLDLDIQ